MHQKMTVHITHRAKSAVETARAVFTRKFNTGSIAAFILIERRLNPNIEVDRISLAFYNEDQRKDLESDVIFADGLELVIAVPLEHEHIFAGKEIDYINDKFIIVP